MTKHIHVHIHRASVRDAGTAHDPSNGQFTTGSGNAAHHTEMSEKHIMGALGGLPSRPSNMMKRDASFAHAKAAHHLGLAAKAHKAGNMQLHATHMGRANEAAKSAQEHEKRLAEHEALPAAERYAQEHAAAQQPANSVVKKRS